MQSSLYRHVVIVVLLVGLAACGSPRPAASPTSTAPSLAVPPAAATAERPAAPTAAGVRLLGGADDESTEAAARSAPADDHQAFIAWLDRGAGAGDLARGRIVAEARREHLRALIRSDPERALAQRLTWRQRQAVPVALRGLLEEPIATTARLGLVAQVGGDGAGTVPSAILADGRIVRHSTYGRRAGRFSLAPVAVWGIAIGDDAALSDRPTRRLDPGEPIDPAAIADGACPVSGAPAAGPALVVGPQIRFLCSAGHMEAYDGAVAAREPLVAELPLESSRTLGRKTLLWTLVRFNDQGSGPSESSARSCMGTVNQWLSRFSYGKFTGFDVTYLPLDMPRNASEYTQGGLMSEALAAAKAAGHDPSAYDHFCVRYNGGPGNFSGAAYVGGSQIWMKHDGANVASHELGHNLGLFHASLWNASGDSVIGAGTFSEYENHHDIMGRGGDANADFNVSSKRNLSWLTDSTIHVVAASGTYRLFPLDHDTELGSGQRQGLRIDRVRQLNNQAVNYWLEYRRRHPGNRWVSNGVLLKTNGLVNSNAADLLLDTTPGTANGKDDAAITFGRTFSDPQIGVHVTPLGFAGTTPESIDVRVEVGAFSGNRPPVITALSGPAVLEPNASGTFTVAATDPDGDALSWFWQFGDGALASNAASAAKSWGAAGAYPVRVVVSDRKGQVASRTLLVTVGTPNTYTIRGTVRGDAGQPLQGVRVHNGGSGAGLRLGWSDSDGSYVLASLGAGPVTVGAVRHGYATPVPTFANPVTVGPSATGKDFTATALPTVTVVATDGTAREGVADKGVWTFTRTGATTAALVVKYLLTGTARSANDYSLTTGYSGQLAIPAGAASAAITLTATDDAVAEGSETAVLDLAPDPAYLSGTPGTARITIAGEPGPANDDFAAAATLSGGAPTASGTNRFATLEIDEPIHHTASNGFSVWYRWTAPATGLGSLTVTASGFTVVTAIYSGSDLTALGQLSRAGGYGTTTTTSFPATEGTTYHIAVACSSIDSNAGPFTLSLSQDASPTAPSFVAGPADRSTVVGQTATFTVVAAGTPAPTLQWQRSPDGISWSAIGGATGASYTIPAAVAGDDGVRFRVVASNSQGSATSQAARLTVSVAPTAPVITAQPADRTASIGQTATFTVAADGAPTPTIQWQRSTGGAIWSAITGATSSTYTTAAAVAGDDGARFRAVATNSAGSATSSSATLTVTATPGGGGAGPPGAGDGGGGGGCGLGSSFAVLIACLLAFGRMGVIQRRR
jgi:hypothetical protein